MLFYDRIAEADRLIGLSHINEIDVDQMSELLNEPSVKRYVLSRLENPEWFHSLKGLGLFDSIGERSRDDESHTLVTFVLDYLLRMAPVLPEETFGIMQSARIGDCLVAWKFAQIGLRLPAPMTARLVPLVQSWIKLDSISSTNFATDIGKWIRHLAEQNESSTALELFRVLVKPSSKKDELTRNHGSPVAEAVASLDIFNLEQIVGEYLPYLSQQNPFAVTGILADSLREAEAIEQPTGKEHELSALWRPAIEDNPQNWRFGNYKDIVIDSLRDSLSQCVLSDSARVRDLLTELLIDKRSIIRRIAIHAIRVHLEKYIELAKPLLRDWRNYHDSEIHHELLLLLQESFPVLYADERPHVLNAIVENAPLNSDPDESIAQKQKKYWILSRLSVISDHLEGSFKKIYQEYEREVGPVQSPTFLYYHESFAGEESPKSNQELAEMSIEDVIDFLRDFKRDEGFRKPSPRGLAHVFAADVKSRPESYLKQSEAFLRAMKPVYLAGMVDAFMDLWNGGGKLDWPRVLDLLLEFVQRSDAEVALPQQEEEEGRLSFVRRRIVDFTGEVLRARGENLLPLEHRSRIWKILEILANDPEPESEYEEQFGGKNMNPPTLALNTIRGKAVRAVVDYSLWVAHYARATSTNENSNALLPPEARLVLETKLDKSKDSSQAVHSVFGTYLPHLCYLDLKWAKAHRNAIFCSEESYWKAAWGGYVSFCRLYPDVYSLLTDDYRRAIDLLPTGSVFLDNAGGSPEQSLAEHMMIAYLNNLESIDTDGLLQRFFAKSNDEIRSHAIRFIERALGRNTKPPTDPDLWKRPLDLWSSRIEFARSHPGSHNYDREFSAYIGWLQFLPSDVEKLFGTITETLRFCKPRWQLTQLFKFLAESAKNHPGLAIAILDQTLALLEGNSFNFVLDEINTILESGSESKNTETRRLCRKTINQFGEWGIYRYRDLLERIEMVPQPQESVSASGVLQIKPSKRVRLIHSPSRIGVTTDTQRRRGGRIFWLVQFPDKAEYIPEDQLELLPAEREHPLDLLAKGKLGRAIDLRRTLTHVRLSGRLTNLLYSMETTNTDFLAYQFKPVIKILNSPSKGVLIADEVGLGKTIEAGLIWTEFRSRFDYRRLFVLCPAFLRVKWYRELRKRFGIEASIVSAGEALAVLKRSAEEGPNYSFAIIGSMQGLRPVRGWDDEEAKGKRSRNSLASFLKGREYEPPLIDMLVIDEAHYLRTPDLKRRKKKTTLLGQLLRNVSDSAVLLSATPIHLRSQDLFQLLNVVDEATFNQPRVFEQILSANAYLVKARDAVVSRKITQEELVTLLNYAKSHPLLAESVQLSAILNSPPSTEQLADFSYRSELAYKLETINLFGHIVTRTRRRDVVEFRVIRKAVPEVIDLTDVERMFYNKVTETVAELCRKHQKHEGFLLVTPQRQMSSSMPAALREWQRRRAIADDMLQEDLGFEAADRHGSLGFVVRELLAKAETFADLDTLWQNDSKYNLFSVRLKELFKNRPEAKVVVFSYFRPTLDYLHERLTSESISSIVLKGGIDIDKDDVVDQFSQIDGPSVLLSSEVGSEGIDLQFSDTLINYDLPWNPMKVEQRIGRIDRIGQKADRILIWNLFYANTIDSRIYERLYKRLRIFEEALGGLEPIIGDEIQRLSLELLQGTLTPAQQEERIEQTAIALENRKREEERLDEEAAHLVAYGDYILNQVKAAKELHRWVTGNDLRVYVIEFFTYYYPGCQFKQISEDGAVFEISLSNTAKLDLSDFIKDKVIRQATALTNNDPRPFKYRFVNRITGTSAKGEEIVNQIHPVIRFVNARLEDSSEYHHPAVAISLKKTEALNDIEDGMYVFVVQKWSAKGVQDLEQLYYSAALILKDPKLIEKEQAERLVSEALVRGDDFLEVRSQIDFAQVETIANEYCLKLADDSFLSYEEGLKNQNADRANVQVKMLDLHLQNQKTILTNVLNLHRFHQRTSLMRATEQRIKILENSMERRKIEIEKKRDVQTTKHEICLGIIKLVSS